MWELETWHPKVLDVLRNHASLSPSDNFSSFISSQFRHIYKPWWDVLFNGDCWPWRRPNRVSQIWILTHFGIIVPNSCWIGKCWYVAVCFWLTLVRVVRGVAFFFFGNGHTQDDHLHCCRKRNPVTNILRLKKSLHSTRLYLKVPAIFWY